MKYLVEPSNRIFVKGMDFRLLLKLWVKILEQKNENISGKYSKERLHHAKQSATDAFKTASKRAIQKMAEAAGDLIGKKNF